MKPHISTERGVEAAIDINGRDQTGIGKSEPERICLVIPLRMSPGYRGPQAAPVVMAGAVPRLRREGVAVSPPRRFSPPILLPDGGELRTLDEASAFLACLAPPECDTLAWQTAITAVLMVTENGSTDFARSAITQALYPKAEPIYDAGRTY